MIYSQVVAANSAVGTELAASSWYEYAPFPRKVTGIGVTGAAAGS